MPGWFHKPGPPPDPSERAPQGSTGQSAQELRANLQEHLQARAELLALETREAGEVVARKGMLGVLIAGLLFFSYLLILIAAVSLLGRWVDSWSETLNGMGWQLVALVAGLLHFVLAAILFNKLKRAPGEPLFEYTRAEFMKDRAWLDQQTTSTKENRNSH